MKKIALSEAKDDLSKVLRMAEGQEIVITRHGKPAGVLIGFKSEDDWFDYRLENDPRLLARVESQLLACDACGKKLDWCFHTRWPFSKRACRCPR
jgi:prevent-host-death family protein